MDNIGFDFNELIKQLFEHHKNEILNGVLLDICSGADEESRRFLVRFVTTANKHGVSTETILKIMNDLAKYDQEDEEEEEEE